MPIRIRRLPHSRRYRVSTLGGVKSYGTTYQKAHAQRRILEAAERNPPADAEHLIEQAARAAVRGFLSDPRVESRTTREFSLWCEDVLVDTPIMDKLADLALDQAGEDESKESQIFGRYLDAVKKAGRRILLWR